MIVTGRVLLLPSQRQKRSSHSRGTTVYNVVISGTGLYTPANSISNDELVESFNTYVHRFNTENAAAIEAGEIQPPTESTSAFIAKASGLNSRILTDKSPILNHGRLVQRCHAPRHATRQLLSEISERAAAKTP